VRLLHAIEVFLEVGLEIGQGGARAFGLPVFLEYLGQLHRGNPALRLGGDAAKYQDRHQQGNHPKRFIHSIKKQKRPGSPTSFSRTAG